MNQEITKDYIEGKFRELQAQLQVHEGYEEEMHGLEQDIMIFMEKLQGLESENARLVEENMQLKYDNKQLKMMMDVKITKLINKD